MTREEAVNRFKGIRESFSISIAQSKFYPSKAELDELCDMAIEALQFAEHFDLLKEHESLQEVVRCKDCRHYEDGMVGYCWKVERGVSEDFYCAYGERKK